jgi:hypothetical protein
MTLSETLYTIAYCLFIVGSARSYRDNGSRLSVSIMGSGVLLDFLVSMLPLVGVAALKMNLPGTNAVIVFAIGFGCIVWLLFLAALWLRRTGRMEAYHSAITVTQIAWFIDFIAFLYGIYKFPLHAAGR